MASSKNTIRPLPTAFEGRRGADIKPLAELEMTRLSAAPRRKPDWWIKFWDEKILAKWRVEALAQAKQMRESHVNYVLQELDGYANLRDEETGIEVSCYDRIWQSDRLIPSSLRERLIANVSRLENVPESEKNWRPGSDGKVLDLVHPSLFPIVYGRTLAYPNDSDKRDATMLAPVPPLPFPPEKGRSYHNRDNNYHISRRFQWLPTDFAVSEDGKAVKSLGYINNLHPDEHAGLHKTIEELVGAYIPLFERALTDSIPENEVIPSRVPGSYRWSPLSGYYDSYDDDEEEEAESKKAYKEWQDAFTILLPDVTRSYVPGSLEKRTIQYSLAGKKIQVIVKLENIYLTPESPEYPGGSWQIEGMSNESIVASGIYYYDQENISESSLAFRTAVDPPRWFVEDDNKGCLITRGIAHGDPCVNHLGSVITSQHRCIAFPNTYQHQVSPFKLVDKTKPGHRGILSLFLIDPAVYIPSTTTIPPQQQEWRASAISANPILKKSFNKLAPEIISQVDSLAEGTMTRKEAEDYRLELMDERSLFVAENTDRQFSVQFSMRAH